MNEKQYVLVVKRNPAENKPLTVKIAFVRPANDIGQTNDTFAVDWQLEETGTPWENNRSGGRHNLASGQTNGRARPTLSLVPPRHKGNR